MNYSKIIINLPHASVEGLYNQNLSFWKIDNYFINHLLYKWTDWHTDYLFGGLEHPKVERIRFPYSRFIVDAERLWNDPLESQGQGIIYYSMDGYQRDVPPKAKERLLNLWKWHQKRLSNSLVPNSLLLDCHSFPQEIDVDICIGYNKDWSKPNPQALATAVNLFEENGYKVGINYPYSNSITPSCSYRYKSMMIEVNKKAYLKKDSIFITENSNYKTNINTLITKLLKMYIAE